LRGERVSPLTVTSGNNPTVFTVHEVAQILRIGRISVYQAIGRGDVPSIRIGRRILIPRAALEMLLNESIVSGCVKYRKKMVKGTGQFDGLDD
jgi:excisionase family DNA binding protein